MVANTASQAACGSAICEALATCDTLVASARLGYALEVDVRPAAVVAGREDGRERDLAVAVGGLHAAQVVLAGDAGRLTLETTP